jgi:hypothetical protein
MPGIEGAHEKGGVEGEVGRFRRRHLTPIPHVPSLAALNEAMAAADARDDARRIGARARTVGDDFAGESLMLKPLPDSGFDASAVLSCRVDAKARVCVRQSYYSVPASLTGRKVQVRLGAASVSVVHEGRVVATHVRSLHKGSEDLVLDHYLEVLTRKPGALAGATALVGARANGSFTTAHQRFWDAARRALGDRDGTRALVGVLLLHRNLPAAALEHAMTHAVTQERFDPDMVAVTARYHLAGRRPAELIPLPLNAIGAARVTRPGPSLIGYDQLLTPTTSTLTGEPA